MLKLFYVERVLRKNYITPKLKKLSVLVSSNSSDQSFYSQFVFPSAVKLKHCHTWLKCSDRVNIR